MRRMLTPAAVVQLVIGLFLYGLAGAFQVRSTLGLDPWDVLHQGIAGHLGLAIGTVVILVGAVVLLAWIPLRQAPGFGTVANVAVIGLVMNAALRWLPRTHVLGLRVAYLAAGVLLCGVATGMYIGAALGPGPRDGLMTGLARRTGRSVRLVRTGIELAVLAAGWLMGGTVGVGTVVFAVAIGPLTQVFLPLFDRCSRARRRSLPVGVDVPVDVPVDVVVAGQERRQPIDRRLELRVCVDEAL